MERDEVFYDLTAFLAHPLRSGIQRVTFEVLRHWAGPCRLVPARVDARRRLLRLPDETLERTEEFFGARPGDPASARRRLVELGKSAGEEVDGPALRATRGLLNTEVFDDWERIAFYRGLAEAGAGGLLYFLVYDLLPWVQPQWFHQSTITFNLPYLRLLAGLPHLAFISCQTRRDFRTRFCRSPVESGPVFCLGSDALGTAAPRFDPACRRLGMIGTLEPRKNLEAVLDALEPLWARGVDVELVCAGRMGWLADDARDRVLRVRDREPRFQWRGEVSDEETRDLIRSSRATLYVSRGEGFGLPPLESLALGVPVIVSAGLPSLAGLEPFGQVRLASPDPEAIRHAILHLLGDEPARALHEEVRRLRLPTWADLGRGLAGWVGGAALGDTGPSAERTPA